MAARPSNFTSNRLYEAIGFAAAALNRQVPMRKDQKLVALILMSWLITGLIEPHLPEYGSVVSAAALTHGLVLSVLLFAWCKQHAKANGIVPPIGSALLVGLISPIGIPYYGFRAYGFKRGGILCLKALATLLLAIALYFGAVLPSSLVGP